MSQVGLKVENQRSGSSEVPATRTSGWPGWGKGGLKGGTMERRCDPEVQSEADGDGAEENTGRNILSKIDRNFFCSPRLIVRGEYLGKSNGTEFKLIVRRKTEGTYVDWGLFNLKTKKQILLVRGEMDYPYNLEKQRTERRRTYGRSVKGGWAWEGWQGLIKSQKVKINTLC